jgi:hypothetical protein
VVTGSDLTGYYVNGMTPACPPDWKTPFRLGIVEGYPKSGEAGYAHIGGLRSGSIDFQKNKGICNTQEALHSV